MYIPLAGTYYDATTLAPPVYQSQPVGVAVGEDVTLALTVENAGGVAVDLTGWAIWFGLKAYKTDAAPLLAVQGTLTTPASGLAKVVLTSAQLQLAAGNYLYDIWGITGAGSREQLITASPFTLLATVYQ